ncbi:MAG TPA: hypothetical protein VFI13_11145 [Gemmatimonadales bacterium]|nr:hypothetical protein [Gemmatimonadales bacterium]
MRSLTLALLPALLLAACATEERSTPPIGELRLDVDTVVLAPAEHHHLALTLVAEDGSPVPAANARWSSSDTGVVYPDMAGSLLARSAGVAEVRVEADGLRDSATVIVRRDWSFIDHHGVGCRLRADAALYCGSTGPNPTPAGAIAVASDSADGQCVLTAAGAIWCRGSDASGALGDGLPSGGARATFAQVSGVADYVGLAGNGGDNYCGLRTGGEVRCWGRGANGELGSDSVDAPAPVAVVPPGLSSFTFSSLATESVEPTICATGLGYVWCWGSEPADTGWMRPRQVTENDGLVKVSVGAEHSCALDARMAAWCWGRNAEGELGRGQTGPVDSTAAPAAVPYGFFDILVADRTTCGAERDGVVWCWGSGTEGQLGRPGLAYSAVPVLIVSVETFVSVHQGGPHEICALTIGGAEYCWGGLTIGPDTQPEDYLPRRTPSPF